MPELAAIRDEGIVGGRMFVCGDIHGCVDQLMAQLNALGFDRSTDKLFALGDLADRGLRSADAIALLDEPWFTSVMGNHEVMMMEAEAGNGKMHVCSGGGWFAQLHSDEKRRLADKVRQLPIAMEVVTPSGRRVGLVHADIPGDDWCEFLDGLGTTQVRDYAMWTRHRVRAAMAGKPLAPIRNIDHVYFGHTPLKAPLHTANMSWIDTGCFATGLLTVEELL